MASPQTENGYTRIANELYEQIMYAGFSKRELLIILAVMRLTYGFNKSVAEISFFELGLMTGIRKDDASKATTDLEEKGVIQVRKLRTSAQGYDVKEIGINKDYEQWIQVRKLRPCHVRKLRTRQKNTGTNHSIFLIIIKLILL